MIVKAKNTPVAEVLRKVDFKKSPAAKSAEGRIKALGGGKVRG